MAARIGGEHGSKNSHENPRSAHRTMQDTRVLSVGGIVVWFLEKRACYRSRRGFSTVAAPPIKLVVPFILESVPCRVPAENGWSVYRPLNRLSIHPDSSPFAVHQRSSLGKGGLQHRALRPHPGPDPLGQVAARIGVRHQSINRWSPGALTYTCGPEFSHLLHQIPAQSRRERSPLRGGKPAPGDLLNLGECRAEGGQIGIRERGKKLHKYQVRDSF